MKIRCVIDGMTLHGMMLSPAERVQLERVLHAQLTAALRAGWAGVAPERARAEAASVPQQLRIDLPPSHPHALGQTLGQSLGTALAPAASVPDAPAAGGRR